MAEMKNEADAKACLKKSMELRQKEKNITERENSVSAKEKEQQKKDDEFQHKEDQLDAQKKILDERDLRQNKREKVLQAQEHFQDVNNRANTASVHRFDEYGNRI